MSRNRLIALASFVKLNGAVKLVVGQVSEGQSAYEFGHSVEGFWESKPIQYP